MPKRTSPRQVDSFDDLEKLDVIVVDKRLGKRAEAKKERRNRHYNKLIIKYHTGRSADLGDDVI